MTAQLAISFEPGDVVVHHKTMNFYRIICFAKEEKTLEPVCVYLEVSGRGNPIPLGKIWTRPLKEFCDGRFGWIM